MASRRSESPDRIACSALRIRFSSTCCSWPTSASTCGSDRREVGGSSTPDMRKEYSRSASTRWQTSTMSCGARAAPWRRAKASRLRTIRAARSDSSAIRRRSLRDFVRRPRARGRRAAPLRPAARSRSRSSAGCSARARRRPRAARSPTASPPGPAAPGSISAARAWRRAGRWWWRARCSSACSRRALAISSVTFFATCTTDGPSEAGPIGKVVTLKICSSGSVTSAREASCVSARCTEHGGWRDPAAAAESDLAAGQPARCPVIGSSRCVGERPVAAQQLAAIVEDRDRDR